MKWKFLAVFMFLSSGLLAQDKMEVGIELSVVNNHQKMDDPGKILKNGSAIGLSGGVLVRYTATDFFYEGGLYYREVPVGFKFSNMDHGVNGSGDEMLMLQLRTGYIHQLSRKFSISPIIGLAPGILVNSGGSAGNAYLNNNNTTLFYEYMNHDRNDNFSLAAQAGISFDYMLSAKLRLSFFPNYNHGFIHLNTTEVDYILTTGNSTSAGKAVLKNYGTYVGYNVGLRYCFIKNKNC